MPSKDRLGHLTVQRLTIGSQDVVTQLLVAADASADLNGEKLVIDADADTYLRQTGGPGGTDDSVDVFVAGAADFRITANTLTALSGSTIATNTIAETTAAGGVTVDGVLLKDGGAVFADAAAIEVDTINEATAAAGVTLDGVLLKDSQVTTDTINEKTPAAGVTADGVLLKDGFSNGRRQSQALTASGAITVGRHGLVTLAHATVIIEATLAAPTAGDDLIIVNTSASGTVAHTVTAAAGVTFDGTNNTATLDAPEEALHLVAVSATRWKIMENIGSVALSNV